MLAHEILHEAPAFKPGKYDWIKDKESSPDEISLAGEDLVFTYKDKEYKFKPVVDAAKKFGSLYKAGRSGKKDSPIRPVVKAIQAYLAKAGLDPGPIDGYYGRNTAKAVVQLQRKLKVTEDGDVGPKTAAAMVEEFKNITVGNAKDNAGSKAKMADNWFSKHTKFSTFDDFFEDFKTRYLSMYRGMQIYLSDFPKSKLKSEPELREVIANDLKDAHAYIQMGQKGSGLVYEDPDAWKRMVEIYSNIPWNKKYVDRVYAKRQEEQQRDLDKWSDDQLGSQIGGTGTKTSKGSAVDQYGEN